MAESFLQSLMGGYQLGSQIKQDRNQSKLAQLASQAYSAPQNERQGILAQAVGVDPKAGMALGDSLQGVDDQRTKTLVQAARYLTAAPEAARPAIWQQMAPTLAQQFPQMQLPDQYDDTVAQTAQALVQAYGGIGDSSELKTFNAMTQGLQPDEVAKARQIALGLQPRAVTGAIKFDTFQGADGRPRPQRNNPTTGGIEIFYDEAGQWVPLGQAQGQRGPAQPQSPGWQQSGPAMFVAEDGQPIPQEDQSRLVQAMRDAEAGRDVNIPASQPAQQQGGALPPPLDYQNGGQRVPGLGVGRSPEEQAALTTAAQERVKLGFLPQQQAIETQGKIAEMQAESKIKPTKAQEAVDTAYGKDYVEFISGGAADANKAMTELDGVIKQLERGDNLTGPVLGALPHSVKVRTNPEAAAAQETVESTVQRSLRVILGAQFTEKEGERLIARAYNPSLPESVNTERVKLLFKQLQEGFENKAAAARYYEQNGTLRGFTGKLPSWGDFNPDGAAAPASDDTRRRALLDKY